MAADGKSPAASDSTVANMPKPESEKPVTPAPESSGKTVAADSPAPAPGVQPAVTREEISQLATELTAAKGLLGEANFTAVKARLEKAESLAKLPKHQEMVARLKEVTGYVEQFHKAMGLAIAELQPAESFTIGTGTQVAFVSAASGKLTVHIGGKNQTYAISDLPAGLAVGIADLKLEQSDPVNRVIKGAYLLVHKRATSDTQEKAKSLWHEAQSAGVDIAHLMPFFTDNYANLLKDAPAEPK
jgi:hypothetical protein